MASTNPFQHADASTIDGVNESIAELGGRRGRRRASGKGRRGNTAKQRKQALRAAMDNGWPEWNGLKPVLYFLIFPGLVALGILVSGPWPLPLLYGCAALMGLWVFLSAFNTVELVLACFLLYLPFSTTYVVPVAPGINGTNMLILLGLFASVLRMTKERQSWVAWPKGSTTVFIFATLSSFSAFTVMFYPGGYEMLLYSEIHSYKAWVDQFIFYFIALTCIRDIETAKRVVLYMCIGAIVLVLYAVPEMLDRMGNSTIEKSRVNGPHRQPNMFGGFVAYSVLPIVALFVTYIKDLRAWLLTPYFLITAKVLISTFSRGAYLAMAAGAFMAAYFKGKGFLLIWATLGLCAVLIFPGLFPDSVVARFKTGSSAQISSEPEKVDKSTEHRIILWRAGGKMIVENPFLGVGFKGFQMLKGNYTETEIKENDPHNTYIYIASQMGLPALMLFLAILAYSFHLGRSLSRNKEDLFIRAVGVGGASATVCYSISCVFGSRAIDLEYSSYFWAYLVCMQIIDMKLREKKNAGNPKKRRTNAYEARAELATDAGAGATAVKAESVAPSADEIEESVPRLLPSSAGQRIRKRTASSLGEAREKRRRLKHHRK